MRKQTNDGLVSIIERALAAMPVGEWQKRFLVRLFSTLLLLRGKVSFSNLARHSHLDDKTYRRGFRRAFDVEPFNLHCIEQRPDKGALVAAMDASHSPKSGKHTYLGTFYNGLGRAVKGLDISELALIDREARQAFTCSTWQTVDELGTTRPEFYAEHVLDGASGLPEEVKYLLVDGYYTQRSFIDPGCDVKQGLEIVGKLRCDANLRYCYRGAYSGRGRPKRYDGKVDFSDLSRFVYEGDVQERLHRYTQTRWHVGLKRTLRVVLVLTTSQRPTALHPSLN